MVRAHAGHALLVMLIVLVVGSLAGIVDGLDGLRLRLARAQAGDDALAVAKEALLSYAVTYRDMHDAEVPGYLPCPDTPDKSGLVAPGDGSAAAGCGDPGEIVVGLLPYRTLGLPDLRDSAGNCLWYAVSGRFKNAPKTVPLNWDTQGQLSVLAADGTPLAAPDDAHGGAAAIVFSPGPALDGQSRPSFAQPCGADPARSTAYLESLPAAFVQGGGDAAGKIVNNDRLVWLTPRDIFSRIAARTDFRNPLGSVPEGGINQLIDAQRKALEGRLWASMAALSATSPGTPGAAALPANHGDYDQFAGKVIGDVPDLKPLNYRGGNRDNYFDNWQEQFRYAVCDDLRPLSGCLAAGARSCRGALFFAGRAAGGGPRPSTMKPHTPPPSRSSWLANYFETGGGLELLAGPALSFAAAGSYDAGAPSADVGVCLAPGGYTSFAKDIGSYARIATSVARPEAAIDVAAKTLGLGHAAATAAGSGCAWFPTPLPFTTSLRAYFKLRIADAGEGFVFAIVDADANAAGLNAGSLCGSATGSHLGYAGAGIVAPKLGLEIDTRVQASNCSGSNRNDPSAQHTAFVYWGTAGTDSDDNCHNAGTAGSGAQPLNPRSLGNGIKTVQASDPHLPYAGNFPLNTDIHVRLEATKSFDGAQLAAASWSPSLAAATITTATPHGLRSGQRAAISGVNPPAWNGSFIVTAIDANHLSYPVAADPGRYVSGGRVAAPLDAVVQAASWTAGSVTVTTAAAHGFVNGQPVSLSGAAPAAYDGTYVVAVVDATRLSFAKAADPGAYLAGGSLRPAVAVSLKAYVASKLLVFGGSYLSTCTSSDLQDLSVDLDELCTQKPTISQDDVYLDVDAATGRALASVYVGFTNAQNASSAAGLQSLTISGFLLKTQ